MFALVPLDKLFADFLVRDQNGSERQFFEDVIGDGPVIVNFVYTHCEGVCPGQGQRFERLQSLLPSDTNIRLISLSIDPARDTVKSLKEWGQTFHAGKHWTLVTASQNITDALCTNLLGMKITPSEHSPFIAIRTAGPKSKWQRIYGLSAAQTVLDELKALSMDRT